jgi:predicted nucleic acid-binding Zn ribbon protein
MNNFESLDRLLTNLAGLPIAQKIKDHQQLLNAWVIAVGPAIASASRPIAIQRDILQVATASAVLANDLTFKRRQILAKLNAQLNTPVRDIRFSSKNWGGGNTIGRSVASEAEILWQEHPSRINPTIKQSPNQNSPSSDPQQAFQAWATRIQQQAKTWPLCPQCHCPTPPGELERWQMCGICATKTWRDQ